MLLPRRGFAVGIGALLFLLWPFREASAVRPQAESRRDAKRFGLDQIVRRQRRAPHERSRQAFARFNRGQGGRWLMRFDPRTGRPSALVGGASAPRPGRPEEAASSFLAESRDLLGIEPESLSLEKVVPGSGHAHLSYRQTYRGLPVEFARVKVHLDARGSVVGVHSTFEPDLSLDISPSLGSGQAAEIVRRDLGAAPLPDAALLIFPSEQSGRSHLAWKFTARGRGGLWRYYVDAHTGQVLLRYNDLRFQAPPPVCLASGTVTGMVYDVDPVVTPGPVARRFNRQRVYVVNGGTNALTATDATFGDGFYCSGTKGKIFAQLQGPFASVSSFRGPSAHYDNGSGVWATVATPISSPHPYPNNAVLISTIDISGLAPGAVKFLPVFSSFNVGGLSAGAFGESLDISDEDEVSIVDSMGFPVAGYVGNRGAFNGAAIPGTLMRLRLKSNASGQNSGYDVSLSSYLTLSNPTDYGPSGSFTWTAASHTSTGLRSEISLFYHLNLMHDYFMSDVNRSSAAYIGSPAVAMALMGPSLVQAFYDPALDKLFFGDVSDSSPSDLFTDDATVPHHEFTHYVVEKIWPIQNFGQAGAISEGLADYFSASSFAYGPNPLINQSSIGTYANTGLGGTGPLRELDCPAKASCRVLATSPSNWAGEIHDDSIYFSQALWDIRRDRISLQGSAAGRSCADGLVFQSLLFFPESFEEFLDAMRRVDAAGAVASCGVGACGGIAANCVQSEINAKFAAHGLPAGGLTSDPYDAAGGRNDGFQTAVDISTLGAVRATIFPGGDLDFYTFGAGPGPIEITLNLPPDGFFFKGYQMTLYDLGHGIVATAGPPFDGINTDSGFCTQADCTTSQPQAVLRYGNSSPNQFFLQVAGGETFSGGSNSAVNSSLPYSLILSYPRAGALSGSIVSASFDNDVISFSVRVTSFPSLQNYSFAYAQLDDQAQAAIPNTMTHVPALGSDFLTMLSSANALGRISGELKLVPGFAARFPAAGTVHLEVFAYNVFGSTISLGLSRPLNLTANRSALTAWNNVFNPARGEKTTVKYEIQSSGHVTIRLYTLDGSLVATLVDDDFPAGKGSVDWFGRNFNGTTVASGIYLLRMEGPGISKTQKIAVVK